MEPGEGLAGFPTTDAAVLGPARVTRPQGQSCMNESLRVPAWTFSFYEFENTLKIAPVPHVPGLEEIPPLEPCPVQMVTPPDPAEPAWGPWRCLCFT